MQYHEREIHSPSSTNNNVDLVFDTLAVEKSLGSDLSQGFREDLNVVLGKCFEKSGPRLLD
jgi:hypothetical protein